MWKVLALGAFPFLFLVFVYQTCTDETVHASVAAVAPTPVQKPAPHVPTAGEKFLAELTPEKEKQWNEMLARVVATGAIRMRNGEVMVGPAFYSLDFDVKSMMIQTIAVNAMIRDKSPSVIVVLVDRKSGNKVGGYTTEMGLHMD